MAGSTFSLDLKTCPRAWRAVEVSPGDERLVEGLREGREAAYESLIDRYQQPIYNLTYRLLPDPSETSDVVQEVFLKIFRKVDSFRGQSNLKTWIYRIAVNEAHNHRRWFGRRRKNEVGLVDERCEGMTYERCLEDPGRSPLQTTLDHETRTLIEQALARLKPAFRNAVVLRDVEELSYEEIAEVLHISLGTVKSRILRGREALRAELVEKLEGSSVLAWAANPAE